MIVNKLKHTFVICAYKESPYLEDCIKSLLAQISVSEGKSDVILYTSTPNQFTTDLCEKYEIKKFEGKSKGIGANWNEALACVSTAYATIAHQDDIYEPEYGVKIIKAFEKNSEINLAFSDYFEIDAESDVRKRNMNLKIKTFGLKLMVLFSSKTYQRRIYAFGNFISCPAVSYNKVKLKNFKFDEELRMAVDWDAWERIMKMPGEVKFIPEQLMAHRIHNESETTANTVDKNREIEEYNMFRRYWGRSMSKLLMRFYTQNQKSNFE